MAFIIEKDNPVLRKKSKEVPQKDFGSQKLKAIISEMRAALAEEEDGVALAAPQIGVSLRIFILAPRVFFMEAQRKTKRALTTGEKTFKDIDARLPLTNAPLVYINPSITKISKKRHAAEEGCLSVRNYYGKVQRAEKATVEAYDERGEKFTRGGSGLLAQIFQHEIDHLDGTLFIDTSEELYYVPPESRPRKSHG